jgi:4,5-DOPA dioxygenase extradiol
MNRTLMQFSESLPSDGNLQPVLFLGHGNPMNAIGENEFVSGFRTVASEIPLPKAILVISAHWETAGTFVTAMDKPRTIHDFGGFPEKLFQQQYPAPGSPDLAKQAAELITTTEVRYDYDWGLDHGAWTVLKHLYPDANIPVIQLSIDYRKDAKYHYDLASQLRSLRDKGILIIGSGNIVHNLRLVDWRNINTVGSGYDWALEAMNVINKLILDGNHQALYEYTKLGKEVQLAIPTPEHFIPLIYTLALQNKNEEVCLFNDKVLAGSLTMTSVRIGS